MKKTNRNILVNFVDEANPENIVLTSSIEVGAEDVHINTSLLEDIIPYGWTIAGEGDFPIEGNAVTVVLRQKDIVVEYVTEDGELVETGSLTVSKESTYINTSWLKDVPEGYEIAIVGDLFIEDGKVKVVVRKPENPDKPDPETPDPETKPEVKPETKPKQN